MEEAALAVFHYQYKHNTVYRQFVDLLSVLPDNVQHIRQIPFLPIELFKSHQIISDNVSVEKIFESSGTTGQITSKHPVADIGLYELSFRNGFERFYGPPQDWVILALLPSYLERGNSSLVYMADDLIRQSRQPESGFYLNNLQELAETLETLRTSGKKILLIGVTFALLDLAEQFPMDLRHCIIMETGGMKGRREELTRPEVHDILTRAFHVSAIHSEYGMTELLSQAYSKGDGIFETPPWMMVLKRDIYDPLYTSEKPGRGGLNVIDLANIHSCSFLATQDLVQLRDDGTFEVLGRIDHSDVRGCNLMVAL
jgi:phenylacetate-coenzyme A ligase PaaK-like adenylate-forming protein